MCEPTSLLAVGMTLSTGLTIYSGLKASQGQQDIGEAGKKYYYYLAGLSDQEAHLSQVQGAKDINTVVIAERGVEAGQRAVMAANGIGAGSVTAEDNIKNTFDQAELDKMAIKYNADMVTQDKKNQAKGYRMSGDNALQTGQINSNTTLLTTASSIADKWSSYLTAKGAIGKGNNLPTREDIQA